MSTALADPVAMVRNGAPGPIHSGKQLERYTEALFNLTAKRRLNKVEEDTVELLTMLIERYEAAHYSLPEADPLEVLRFLMTSNGLTQRDLAKEFGSESTASLVLSSKRELAKNHIRALSKRFHVSPAVFF
jgi:HTH-type transcriptional regulator/antitoxin HigA